MSNLIISIEELLGNLFKETSNSFAGKYHTKNKEVDHIIKELYKEEIPTSRNDRANLRSDASKVASDYKKAFELKKLEY